QTRPIRSCSCFDFFLSILSPPRSTLFPYTTLFRSSPDESGNVTLLPADIGAETPSGAQAKVNALADKINPLIADLAGEVSDLARSEEHTSELQSRENLVCRLLLEKKKSSVARLQYR